MFLFCIFPVQTVMELTLVFSDLHTVHVPAIVNIGKLIHFDYALTSKIVAASVSQGS